MPRRHHLDEVLAPSASYLPTLLPGRSLASRERAALLSNFLQDSQSQASLGSLKAAVLSSASLPSRRNHEEFLFGGGASLELSGRQKRNIDDFFASSSFNVRTAMAPASSVLANGTAVYAALKKAVKEAYSKMPDPCGFTDGEEDEKNPEFGWSRFIPSALKVKVAIDIGVVVLLTSTLRSFCDVPLRKFLIGMLLLGFPTTYLTNFMAKSGQSKFTYYRLTVTAGKNCKPEQCDIDELILLDRFGSPLKGCPDAEKNGATWTIALPVGVFITGYQIRTNRSGSAQDPISWYLEASHDYSNENWVFLDECSDQQLPAGRGVLSIRYEDLIHTEAATSSFKLAFLFEILANACAFLWLVKGTGWVSSGSYSCIDTAPSLWYFCYLIVVVLWSFIGTITIGLILSAVAMIVVGNRSSA